MVSVVLHKNRSLWGVDSAQGLCDIAQENFPHTIVTDIIDEYNVKEFLRTRTSNYRPIRVLRSVTGTTTSGSGVIVMGDVAHSFSPELGQGFSAASEDVGILRVILSDPYDGKQAIKTLMQRYEKQRMADVRALVRIHMHGATYLLDQNKTMERLSINNAKMRAVLSRWFPGSMFNAIRGQMFQDLSYAEILRRADLTTARIWVSLAFTGLLLSYLTTGVFR